MERPDQKTIDENLQRTREQIERIVGIRVNSAKPSQPSNMPKHEEPTFIRYTPSQSSSQFNSGAKARIIKMVQGQKDPIDPSYFHYKKMPSVPTEEPVPVLHEPPKKLTAKDYAAWKIPPAISNWKNNLGFTVSLDKRLAADGRGLEAPVISDRFASLANVMMNAEALGRAEIEERKHAVQKVREQQQDQTNRELAELANSSRLQARAASQAPSEGDNTADADAARSSKALNGLLSDIKRDAERDYRLNRYKGSKASLAQRSTADASSVSKSKGMSSEAIYDRRLFTRDDGAPATLGNDDDYNVYTKPLFSTEHSGTLYRPVGDSDTYGISERDMERLKDTKHFHPDRGFSGTAKSSGPRTQPVEFQHSTAQEDDEIIHGSSRATKERRRDTDGDRDRETKRHRDH